MSDRESPVRTPEILDLVDRSANAHARSSKGPIVKFSRAWNVFKYYRKSQLARRAFSVAAKRIGMASKSLPNASPVDLIVRETAPFEIIRSIRTATSYRCVDSVKQNLLRGGVEVLNQWQPLNWRIEHAGDASNKKSLLWQFQLHYHEYLLPLADDSGNQLDEGVEAAANLSLIEQTLLSWLEQNPIDDPSAHLDAWHPYCISRRLPVWFCLLTLENLNSELRERLQQSAHLQAEFLSQNLEWDLRGNHLLENIRALSLAACYFDTSQSDGWLRRVHDVLPLQIKEQVLNHGEHFERCPMYHCQILGNFLEMMIASQSVDTKLNEQLRPVAESMFGFLVEIVHPDGEIPLLGDSCFGEAPSVDCIGQLADAAELNSPSATTSASSLNEPSSRVGDYWIYRDQSDYLIFDRGPAGADRLPAHAHCDLMTMESSINGVRWLVDSGIFNYDDDEMRWYCRSSLAHNVVCVDDQNQFDIWSKFRMGYRGWPNDFADGSHDGFSWATASHNAYRRFGISKSSRMIGIQANKFWYCIDRMESAGANSDTGSGLSLNGFLHLGPEVQLSQTNEHSYRLEFGGKAFDIAFYSTSNVQKVESWYCPEFGKRMANSAIEYRFAENTNLAGWLMTPSSLTNDPHVGLPSLKVKRQNRVDQITITNPSNDNIHSFDWKT